MSLGQIATSLSDTVGSFAGVFAFGRTGPYQNFEGVTNRIIPGNWKLTLPYSFRVIGVDSAITGANSPLSGLFNVIGQPTGGGLFDEFFLPLNPQDIAQDENFSIVATPTQRGVVVEHNAVVFKDLVISGTTGMRPFLDKSGYECFQQLRNYFRSYAQIKKSPNQQNAQLIFVNRKDNEYLVVEPQKFSMKRSASGPFLYNYSIMLKVLGATSPNFAGGILGDFFERVDRIAQDITDNIQKVRFIFQESTQLVKTVEREFTSTLLEPIETIGLTFKTVQGLPYTLADLPSSVANELSSRTITAFLDSAVSFKESGDPRFAALTLPIDTAKEATDFGAKALEVLPIQARDAISLIFSTSTEKLAFNKAVSDALSKSRNFYSGTLETNDRIRDNAAERFGVGSAEYDSFIGRTSTFEADPDRVPSTEEIQLLSAFDLVDRAINVILSTELFFSNTISDYTETVRRNYDSSLQLGLPQSVDELVLPHGATLEDLAAEFLGSAERWIDIAVVNNLVAPYIEEGSTNPRVKKSGDRILIPRAAVPELSNIPKTKTNKISESLTETERNLGVDIKVNKDFDFILNNLNDVELVAGGSNAGQAVILKIATEKGSLKYHPQLGVGLNIGQKIRNGQDIRDDLIQSILSDRRFTGIKNLSFFTEGSTIRINLELSVKHLLTPVPLSIPV